MSAHEAQLLRVRDLIADKEAVVARMNHDTAKYGEWRGNYEEWLAQVSAQLDERFKRLGVA